jgi:hypothetical protein
MNRLPFVQRVLLHVALLVLLATGITWEMLSPGPWAAFLMKVHGAFAMLALVMLGTLVTHHIPAGWASLKNRWSGVLLLGGMAWLVMTGYLLYYAGGDSLRLLASQSHLWVGLAACMVVAFHIRRSAVP